MPSNACSNTDSIHFLVPLLRQTRQLFLLLVLGHCLLWGILVYLGKHRIHRSLMGMGFPMDLHFALMSGSCKSDLFIYLYAVFYYIHT